MYLERRIQASIHGDAEFDFSALIGWKALGVYMGTATLAPVITAN